GRIDSRMRPKPPGSLVGFGGKGPQHQPHGEHRQQEPAERVDSIPAFSAAMRDTVPFAPLASLPQARHYPTLRAESERVESPDANAQSLGHLLGEASPPARWKVAPLPSKCKGPSCSRPTGCTFVH